MSEDLTELEIHEAARAVVEHVVAVPNSGRDLTPFEDDAFAVATAWQLDHEADDAEPVTAEWLKAVGFTDDPDLWFVRDHHGGQAEAMFAPAADPEYPSSRGVMNTGDGWGFYLTDADGFDGSQNYVCEVPTRGHVRRLCAALGVELKEAA